MPKNSNSTYLVGIAGGSASGKSLILKELLSFFEPGDISFITQDNYYLDRIKQVVDENGEVNFDLPTAIDRDALVRDVDASGRMARRLSERNTRLIIRKFTRSTLP